MACVSLLPKFIYFLSGEVNNYQLELIYILTVMWDLTYTAIAVKIFKSKNRPIYYGYRLTEAKHPK